MSSSARLARLRKRLQPDIDALPNRIVSSETIVQSDSDSDDAGGISLEPLQSLLDFSDKQNTPDLTDPHSRKVENNSSQKSDHEHHPVSLKDTESSHTPKMSSLPSSIGPPEPAAPLPNTGLQRGDLASAHDKFTAIQALARYPYKYCDQTHFQDVASAFFDQGKFWEREWDLYYVWDIEPGTTKPIILIRESQVMDLLGQINHHLQLRLRITKEQREERLVTSFPDHPRCLPRYLGRSHSREEFDLLAETTPSDMHYAPGEPAHPQLEGDTLQDFKQRVQDLRETQKAKSKAFRLKKQQERLVKQKKMADHFKRTQRYLGLRSAISNNVTQSGPPMAIDPLRPAPFIFDQSVVFVCIDVESYERDHRKITEVGVTTLDTRDLVGVSPGIDGAEWMKLIRARHFLVKEYRHLKNSRYVIGYPDKFTFGESVEVPLKDIVSAVAECFHAPFSVHQTNTSNGTTNLMSNTTHVEKRNLILLGHDPGQDIRYLKQLGYDLTKVENILEALDTAVMNQLWRREQQSSSLEKILRSFDIEPWYLHNAGNDAAYTVQAMLALCVREASIRGSSEIRDMRAELKAAKLKSSPEDDKQRVKAEADAWSDTEKHGDGGAPMPLAAEYAIKPTIAQTSTKSRQPNVSANTGGRSRSPGRSRGRGNFSTEHAFSGQQRNDGQYTGSHGSYSSYAPQGSGREQGERSSRFDRRAHSPELNYGYQHDRPQRSTHSTSGNAHPNPEQTDQYW